MSVGKADFHPPKDPCRHVLRSHALEVAATLPEQQFTELVSRDDLRLLSEMQVPVPDPAIKLVSGFDHVLKPCEQPGAYVGPALTAPNLCSSNANMSRIFTHVSSTLPQLFPKLLP